MLQHLILFLCITAITSLIPEKAPEMAGVRYPNKCETCKVLATELQDRLQASSKRRDVVEIGYSLDDVKPKKRTQYRKSELRLLETLENICDRVLTYNLHKERDDSTRFAKGMSETFKTLHGLVDKGVQVDLGIPYEMWDKPPVEVMNMKTQCENLVEQYEDHISDWYYKLQDEKSLITHLCVEEVLKDRDQKCLEEELPPEDSSKGDKDEL